MVTNELARLRASRDDFHLKQRDQGEKFGQEWAMGEASYEQLARLAQLSPEADYSRDEILVAIDCEYDADPFGDEITTPTFLRAFLDGAREVFDRV